MINYSELIHTPNLHLRILDLSDASAVQVLLSKNKEHMIPWVPWAGDEPETVEEKKLKIRVWKGEFYLDKKYVYGVFEKNNDQLIGLVFLFSRQGPGTLEIGYVIDYDMAGKGYATESSYALTKLGFEHLNVQKIYIICNQQNKASSRIPEKLNYQLEGIRKSAEKDGEGTRTADMFWVLLEEDFSGDASYEPTVFVLNDE